MYREGCVFLKISGLIFAGGKGERMQANSKPMVLLNNKPLILYGIEALLENGITDITIIRNSGDDEILSVLNIYRNSEANITFLDDSFQKGAHFAYLYFEHQLRFPLISLDCDIYFEQKDFSEMLNGALKIFDENSEVASALAVSITNPFDEPKTVIIKNNKVVDYVSYGDSEGCYGGFIFIWRESPCRFIRKFYKYRKEEQSFINYYTKYNLMVPIYIQCIWDIDTPKRIVESEKLIRNFERQKTIFWEVIETLKKQKSILSIALGGSRSRKYASKNSDYDIFCLIKDNDFINFKHDFSSILHKISDINLAVEAFYLENFGYLFKVLGCCDVQLDISILPLQRANEMGIRSTNIIIYDPFNIYSNLKKNADDNILMTANLEKERISDYMGLFYFEWLRLKKSLVTEDYWLALKAVERMKIYYMHMYRIVFEQFASTPHCPEKEFESVCNDELKEIYIIDGTLVTLRKTAIDLKKLFEDTFNPEWTKFQ